MKRTLLTAILLGIVATTFLVQKSLTKSPTVSITEGLISQLTPQPLPIAAKVQIGSQMIELEVADTPEKQQQGLMYRTELDKNRGMLFTFEPPRVARFWMKNTLIPLDMIFLREGEVKAIFANVSPCRLDPCPTYGPSVEVDQVIELVGGRAKELGLEVGDRLEIIPLKTPQ